MSVRILFVLCLLLPAAPVAGEAHGAQEPGTIECPTCAGDGRIRAVCATCEGKGRIECRRCHPLQPSEGELHPRGTVVCPLPRCRGGKLAETDADCRMCRGRGFLPCPRCKKRKEEPCPRCAGKRKVKHTCPDCAGKGALRLPAPGISPKVCLWCSDAGRRWCQGCDEEGSQVRICTACKGKKKVECKTCLGLQKIPCPTCEGGRVLSSDETCGQCRGRGFRSCTSCKGGFVPCSACQRSGKVATSCWNCDGRRIAPCRGCHKGSYRFWELTGSILVDRPSTRSSAVPYLEIAIDRCASLFGDRIAKADDNEVTRVALERDRDAELERLGELLDRGRR